MHQMFWNKTLQTSRGIKEFSSLNKPALLEQSNEIFIYPVMKFQVKKILEKYLPCVTLKLNLVHLWLLYSKSKQLLADSIVERIISFVMHH